MLTPKTARERVAEREPTVERLEAAEYLEDIRTSEPSWPLWAAADFTVGLGASLALIAPGAATALIGVYAAAYAVALIRVSKRAGLLAASHDEKLAAAADKVESYHWVLGIAMAVLYLIAAAVSVYVVHRAPVVATGAGIVFAALAVRRYAVKLQGFRRAAEIVSAASNEPWYPQHLEAKKWREVLMNHSRS